MHSVERPEWTWVGDERVPNPALSWNQDAGGIRCIHTFDADSHANRVECRLNDRLIWYRQDRSHLTHAALAQWGETLIVARFGRITSGCVLEAYEIDSGVQEWTVALEGLGPIDHSRYTNAVQVSRQGDHLFVFGHEAAGKYIEVVDVRPRVEPRQLGLWRESEGEWNAHAIPREPSWRDHVRDSAPDAGEASARTFEWVDGRSGLNFEYAEQAQHGSTTCTFEGDDHAVELACKDGDTLLWGWRVEKRWESGAKLVVDEQRLYVARYHPGASGCGVRAYDLTSGAELWWRGLYGVGPVTHSAYQNDVQARLEGERLVVFGWESANRYVEMLRARDGELRGHRLFGHQPRR